MRLPRASTRRFSGSRPWPEASAIPNASEWRSTSIAAVSTYVPARPCSPNEINHSIPGRPIHLWRLQRWDSNRDTREHPGGRVRLSFQSGRAGVAAVGGGGGLRRDRRTAKDFTVIQPVRGDCFTEEAQDRFLRLQPGVYGKTIEALKSIDEPNYRLKLIESPTATSPILGLTRALGYFAECDRGFEVTTWQGGCRTGLASGTLGRLLGETPAGASLPQLRSQPEAQGDLARNRRCGTPRQGPHRIRTRRAREGGAARRLYRLWRGLLCFGGYCGLTDAELGCAGTARARSRGRSSSGYRAMGYTDLRGGCGLGSHAGGREGEGLAQRWRPTGRKSSDEITVDELARDRQPCATNGSR